MELPQVRAGRAGFAPQVEVHNIGGCVRKIPRALAVLRDAHDAWEARLARRVVAVPGGLRCAG